MFVPGLTGFRAQNDQACKLLHSNCGIPFFIKPRSRLKSLIPSVWIQFSDIDSIVGFVGSGL